MPDPLKDTNAERSKEVAGMMDGLIPRLTLATNYDMQEVIVSLWSGPATDLYSHKAHDRAANITAAILGTAPGWCKLERDHGGNLHAHIITSTDAPLLLPAGATTRPVYNLKGLLHYLSKPGDARAAMVRDLTSGQTRTYQNTEENKLAAFQDYQRARAQARGRQFPRLSWSHNLPRLSDEQKAAIRAM
ncbi:hypothetical protein [Deinococcus ficus]|uniref:hypothetical protein n=1 Tax=Deinococcus ficus TaxID=317577 RepID=UPI00174A93A6|nr:hypothetical protein [Deinococcus ficus]